MWASVVGKAGCVWVCGGGIGDGVWAGWGAVGGRLGVVWVWRVGLLVAVLVWCNGGRREAVMVSGFGLLGALMV